ncbi:hypothetical protein Unana1_08946 [Umbelopsis nana]
MPETRADVLLSTAGPYPIGTPDNGIGIVDLLVRGIGSEDDLKTAIEKFPIVFKQSGNLVGSNLPLKVDGSSLDYDTSVVSSKYTATNIYGDKVSITYTGSDTNTILGMMENQDDTTKGAMTSLFDNTVPANDMEIVRNAQGKDAAGIFGDVSSVSSDIKNDYLKGLLKLQGVLQNNVDIFHDTAVTKMIDQITQLRTTYNEGMIGRSNDLANAYLKWTADPSNIIKDPTTLKSSMPDVYDVFNNNGYITQDAKGNINPLNQNKISKADSGKLTYSGTNFADLKATAAGEAPVVCV